MLNQALRYGPIVDGIRSRGTAGAILDVGAGANGLARYVGGRTVIGVDLTFDRAPHRRMRPVVASGLALPFRDRTFDEVVCSDMLEHVPQRLRRAVVEEMLRVCAGTLTIGFPAGPLAAAHDHRLAGQLDRMGLRRPPWLDEHLDLTPPETEAVVAWARATGAAVRVHGNANARVHRLLTLAEELPPVGFLTSRLVRRPLSRRSAERLSRGPCYRALLVITPAPIER